MPEEINDKISIPNDMDELMEWVFGEQVATENEEDNEEDTEQ